MHTAPELFFQMLLDDPAKATGSEAEIMAVFRASRDEIKQRVEALLQRLQAGSVA